MARGNRPVEAGLLIRRFILRPTGRGMFPITGFAQNALGFPFTGDFLVELIDDVLQLLGVVQLLFVWFCHIAPMTAGLRGRPLRRARCPSHTLPRAPVTGELKKREPPELAIYSNSIRRNRTGRTADTPENSSRWLSIR